MGMASKIPVAEGAREAGGTDGTGSQGVRGAKGNTLSQSRRD
jgi:hypothetical protein